MNSGNIEHEPGRYEEIATAIGQVCLCWRSIEEMVHLTVLRLSDLIDPDLARSPSAFTLHVILSEIDLPRKIASANTLAFVASGKKAEPLFIRTQELLNLIDNKLRPERNRYVHNEWLDLGNQIVRGDNRARISKPQSHLFMLTPAEEKSFSNLEKIYGFVSVLEATVEDLDALRNHVWSKMLVNNGELKLPQNLPEQWASINAFNAWKTALTEEFGPQ